MQNIQRSFVGEARLVLVLLLLIAISACSGGGSSSSPQPVNSSPPPAPASLTLTGIAAIGAALDGATVEIIDASGNLVEIPDTLTGTDGSYQVILPSDVALPVIVRITPPSGEILLNIIPEQEPGTTEIVANVNPITNLVVGTVLGDVDETNTADLAAALAVTDTTTIDETGDAIVEKILGSNVDYDAFASDPSFAANDGSGAGSAADAILDTVANLADDSGVDLATQLSTLAEQTEPAKLLEDPVFQIELVSELVKGGTDSQALESQLAAIGAIADPVADQPDVFRAIIETVPVIIESTITNAAELGNNDELLDLAVDAVVDLIANTVEQKTDRFDASDTDLVSLLSSPSFQETAVDVITTTVVPILSTFVDDADVSDVLVALETVVENITEQAASVTSGIEFNETSTDVSDLVSSFVQEMIAPDAPITREDLSNIQAGTADASDLVTSVGDVSQVQGEIQDFAEENPDLIEGPASDLIDVIPTGTWSDSNWGDFNWG